jgi:hypothetical protein
MPESKLSWKDEGAAIEAALSLLSIGIYRGDGSRVAIPKDVYNVLRDLYRRGKRDQALYDAPHMRRPETPEERQARINRLYGRKVPLSSEMALCICSDDCVNFFCPLHGIDPGPHGEAGS